MRKNILPILIALVLLLACSSIYFFQKFNQSKNSPDKIAQQEVKTLVSRVSNLMILPKDETPTVATVSDPSALKGQTFFVDAKKGDKVLIYSNAKKAILYDPEQNKIVTIAPLNIGNTPSVDTVQQVQSTPNTTTTKTQTTTKKK